MYNFFVVGARLPSRASLTKYPIEQGHGIYLKKNENLVAPCTEFKGSACDPKPCNCYAAPGLFGWLRSLVQ